MKKRKLSLLTAVVLTFSLLSSLVFLVGSAASDNVKLPFKDVKKGHWFYSAVYDMYTAGYMEGTSESRFEPNETMTRAQLVTLMARLAGADTSESGQFAERFKDIGKKSWYKDAVGWAARVDLAQGYEGGLFKPNDPIRRMELATFMVRLIDYIDLTLPESPIVESFKDQVTFPSWARDSIESMRVLGLIKGDERGKFNAYSSVTRAEIATIVSRFAPYLTRDPMHRAAEQMSSVLDSVDGRSLITLGDTSTVNAETLSRILIVCGSELDEEKYCIVFDEAQLNELRDGAYASVDIGETFDTELDIAIKNKSTNETTEVFRLTLRIKKVADLAAETVPEFMYKLKTDGTAEITDYNGVRFVRHLTIPSELDGARVTSIGKEAFKESRELVSVTIPDSVTFIDTEAFSLCTSLESVTIPDCVTKIGRAAFYYCTSLTSVTLPEQLERIPDYMFYMCTSLAHAYTSDSLEEIGKYSFSCCRLEEFNFNEGLEIVGEYAFEGCALTEVYLPDSCTYAGHWAFYNCTWLESASFGDRLELIGSGVLYNTAVTELRFRGSAETFEQIYRLSAFDEDFKIAYEK